MSLGIELEYENVVYYTRRLFHTDRLIKTKGSAHQDNLEIVNMHDSLYSKNAYQTNGVDAVLARGSRCH